MDGGDNKFLYTAWKKTKEGTNPAGRGGAGEERAAPGAGGGGAGGGGRHRVSPRRDAPLRALPAMGKAALRTGTSHPV